MKCRDCNNESEPNRTRCFPHLRRAVINSKAYVERDPNRELDRQKRHRLALRSTVVEAYGGCCKCCGETFLPYLQIDHVNGGGRKDRENGSPKGTAWYRMIIRDNFPDTLQILCANCHAAKTYNLECKPHDQWSL